MLSLVAIASMVLTGAVPASAHRANPASVQNVAQIAPTDWPGYMYGPAHHSDNFNDFAITPAKVASLKQVWHVSGGRSFLSSPVVADGFVFIGDTSGNFYEINAATGVITKRVNLGHQPSINCPARGFVATAAVAVDPADHQDTVYVADPSGYLDALAIPSLTLKWHSAIAIPSKTRNDYFDWSSPTVANGKIYVGIASNCNNPSVRGGVRAFDQATGHTLATFYSVPPGQVGGAVWTSVAVDSSGFVYAATGNTPRTNPQLGASIVKLDPNTLKPLGHFTIPLAQRTNDDDFSGSPTIFGFNVGACNHNGIYYAVRRSTMKEVWQKTIGVTANARSQCAAGAIFDGTNLFISGNGARIGGRGFHASIRRVNPANGNFSWQTGLANGVIGAPTMNAGGVIVVGTYDITTTPNDTYLVNASNGQILRKLNMGSFDFAQSTFANGWLFTANSTGLQAWKP